MYVDENFEIYKNKGKREKKLWVSFCSFL
jgi:hypothetical protein